MVDIIFTYVTITFFGGPSMWDIHFLQRRKIPFSGTFRPVFSLSFSFHMMSTPLNFAKERPKKHEKIQKVLGKSC